LRQFSLPSSLLLVFLAAALFLATTVWLMLGPLLVELANVFHTTVAVTGQLTTATAITWSMTAFLAGPVSDSYGRGRMLLTGLMLMMLGMLSSTFAWTYGALFVCRCLTGVGAAMIVPNCLATVADVLLPERHGKALGWLSSAAGLAPAVGIPLVALLADIGGWRLPFYVLTVLLLILWGLLWVWFPSSPRQPGHVVSYFTHFHTVGVSAVFWYVLAANCLQEMVFVGILSYLPPYLMQAYHLSAAETALPLTIAGLGAIVGSPIGGRVAGQPYRLAAVAGAFLGGGVAAALVFTTDLSPWATAVLAFGVAGFLSFSWPVTLVLLTELAGQSRATATGLFVVSNQVGTVGGASLGGVMLSLGGFPLVSLLCFATAATAAVVIHYQLRRAAENHRPSLPSDIPAH
jgi:predicted MFS family arabinose efflux permease